MQRLWRVLGFLAAAAVILAVAFNILWAWFSRQAFPKTIGSLQVAGLEVPVEIYRDPYGVAHIYAQNRADLYFAQGYVHAQERFWQMEFQRRTGAGRLSEIFGEATYTTDRYLRHFNFYANSQEVYRLVDEQTRQTLDAYAAGVNAYISGRSRAQLGLEFALLELQGVTWEIEPWQPADSIVWAMMMIYDQGDQWESALDNASLLATVGSARYAELHGAYRPDRPVIVSTADLLGGKAGASTARLPRPAQLGAAELNYLLALRHALPAGGVIPSQLADLGFGLSGGSNSFVVSGSLTASGKPILANDPHMGINIPPLWYEIGLHCVEKSAACPDEIRGFSLPGVPATLIGHNDRIAWGLTNAAFDAEDVFIEKINPANPDEYLVGEAWQPVTIRREEIGVRGEAAPRVIFVRGTRNGVIVSDYLAEKPSLTQEASGPQPYALVFNWPALQPVQSVRAVLKVNIAQNWDDFVDALQYFEAGKQNWLYADVDGNIGYVLPGKIPVRAGGDGTLPVPGWTEDYRWTGFIPYDELPRAFNPLPGFIVTANNPQVRQADYAHFLGVGQDRGQRAARLTSLIAGKGGGLTVEDLMLFQTDNASLLALEMLPYLKTLSLADPAAAEARDRLLAWDGQMMDPSPEAALYALFWARLVNNTFADDLGPDVSASGRDDTEDVILGLLQQPASPWWDDRATAGAVEDRDAILQRSLEQAYADGAARFGGDFAKWQWGQMHTITFVHATLGRSGIAFIEDIFNRGPFPTNGSESVVQKTCWSINDPFAVTCIPALRQVIDLGNLGNSRMVHSVGQSGHPYHRFYDHLIETWRHLNYNPSNWERSAVEVESRERLVLEPAP